MTKNVFLIGAEHQMAQVNFAKSHFDLDPKTIVVFIEKTYENENFISKLKNTVVPETIIFFESWTFKDLIYQNSKSRKFISICQKYVNQEVVFFASHYDTDSTLLFNSIVKPKKMYLMDEGNASFLVKAKRKKNSLIDKIKFIVKSVFYKKVIQLPKKLVYFTQFKFDLPKNDTAIIYKKPIIQNPLQDLIQKELGFIGSTISENEMISEQQYLLFLQNIKNQHLPLIDVYKYYPHRKENPKKLELISGLGFEIVKIDEPFEDWFSKQTNVSEVLCSFYTTGVIYNIEISNQVLPKLIIYKFESNLLKLHKKIYDDIYTTFIKNKSIIFETL